MTTQKAMAAKLAKCGIPHKEIECYGSQIVITSHCRDTADKWASLLAKFATVRCVVEALDYAKENKFGSLNPTTVKVWRTFAHI